jgi:TatD DNase family protein
VLVDSHCHLGHIEAEPRTTIDEAWAEGVDVVVDIGMGTEESAAAVARARDLDGVYASVGIHPNELTEFQADAAGAMDALATLAADPRVVGIGETGLDFYRNRSQAQLQEDAFREHIALALQLDRTLVIHCRDAQARVLEILDDAGAPPRVIMHCFSGDAEYARECAERGFFCSFAGNVTFPKADELREAAAALPPDLLLAETDAPFLAPVPFRGKPNAPKLLSHTVRRLADVRMTTLEQLAVVLRDNSKRAFGIDI